MGHQVVTTAWREKPEVRAKIDKCNDLIDTLTSCKEEAEKNKTAADEAVEDCKKVINTECENLSGVYYEEKYIPYKDGFFSDIEGIDGGCDSMFTEIDDRVKKLRNMVSELEKDLWEEYEVSYWVDDD